MHLCYLASFLAYFRRVSYFSRSIKILILAVVDTVDGGVQSHPVDRPVFPCSDDSRRVINCRIMMIMIIIIISIS